jgi:hypothetical protein
MHFISLFVKTTKQPNDIHSRLKETIDEHKKIMRQWRSIINEEEIMVVGLFNLKAA